MRTTFVLLTTVVAIAFAPAASGYVTQQSTIAPVAGNGTDGFSGDGGPATDAQLRDPRDSAVGPDGSLYITDTYNHRVRRVDPQGVITTVAGNGSSTYNGDDMQATQASLYWPHDVEVGPDGTIYIADSNHHRIRKVDANGIITTLAGTGVSGASGDGGLATKARLKNPKTVVHHAGWLYTAGHDHKVRRINLTSGIIERVAGSGVQGYSGDGGSALTAMLNGPQRVQVDSRGNVYVADAGNHRIRRVEAATGIITTVAGTGVAGYSGDGGAATKAMLNTPRGIALENDQYLYIADSYNHKVRRVDLATGIIHRVAGSSSGYSGNGGPAGSAKLRQPRGLTVLPNGDLVVADTFNSAIRVIDGMG